MLRKGEAEGEELGEQGALGEKATGGGRRGGGEEPETEGRP